MYFVLLTKSLFGVLPNKTPVVIGLKYIVFNVKVLQQVAGCRLRIIPVKIQILGMQFLVTHTSKQKACCCL